MSQTEHKAHAPRSVRCFVLTISDTRTEATDSGGRAIGELLDAAGHVVVERVIIRDDQDLVRQTIDQHLDDSTIQVIITTGWHLRGGSRSA